MRKREDVQALKLPFPYGPIAGEFLSEDPPELLCSRQLHGQFGWSAADEAQRYRNGKSNGDRFLGDHGECGMVRVLVSCGMCFACEVGDKYLIKLLKALRILAIAMSDVHSGRLPTTHTCTHTHTHTHTHTLQRRTNPPL